jgi:amino acid adenylation domain-containing protein
MKKQDGHISNLSLENKRQILARMLRERAGRSQTSHPLSVGQQALWFQNQLAPISAAYNLGFTARIVSAFDAGLMRTAVERLIDRHPILRSTYRMSDGNPSLFILGFLEPLFVQHDAAGLSEDELSTAVQRCNRAPFDLENGPIIRVHIFSRSDSDHVLLLSIPHIACDGWSMGLLIRDLRAFCEAQAGRRLTDLAPLHSRYTDFIEDQRRMLAGSEGDRLKHYWIEQLGGEIPVLELPLARPRPPVRTYEGATHYFDLGDASYRKIRALTKSENATLYTVLLSAFQILLMRYSGQEDVPIGTPVAGRNRAEYEPVIGLFINQVAMRGDLSGNPTFSEVLKRNRRIVIDAIEHQSYPFPLLAQKIQPIRDPSCHPVFQVLFNLLGQSSLGSIDSLLDGSANETPMDFGPFKLKPFNIPQQEGQFDLALEMMYSDEKLMASFRYCTDIFDAATIARMGQQYRCLLAHLADNPDQRVWDLPLNSDTGCRHFLEMAMLDPTAELPPAWTGAVADRVAEHAKISPERTAVVEETSRWSYGDIERISNQMANRLLAAGVGSGDTVAVYGHRSVGLVLSLLGVLKARAAFFILDPAYPAARLIKMLRAAKPSGLLLLEAAGEVGEELNGFIEDCRFKCRLNVPRSKAGLEGFLFGLPPGAPGVSIGPEDTAYLIFTSGTTGEPKGIVGTHKPLSHFLDWHTRTFELRESDRFSMLSGLSHDPLLRDIFTPLWVGGTLCIPEPEEVLIPERLRHWMREQGVTVSHMTPALSQVLTEGWSGTNGGEEGLSALRHIFFGGDVLTWQHVERVRRVAPRVECVNFYGATETPQAMGYHVVGVNDEDAFGRRIPLGQGIEGAQLLVLNIAGRLAGVGELGEIHVRTPYLSKGYLNDSDLTDARYIQNPYISAADDKLYRTGDLGRYMPDGAVMFYGRKDGQVSVRGFRVEFGEIEANIKEMNAVSNCVAILREDGPGDQRLVAYYVLKPGHDASISDWRNYLRSKLPEYMVPQHFVELESIPLTPNGKVDRKALPKPEADGALEQGYVAPRTETEQKIAGVWQEVLNREKVGVHDDFFDLGGHSLLATQVLTRLNQSLNIKLPLRKLFEARTVESMARLIETSFWSTGVRQPGRENRQDEREIVEL